MLSTMRVSGMNARRNYDQCGVRIDTNSLSVAASCRKRNGGLKIDYGVEQLQFREDAAHVLADWVRTKQCRQALATIVLGAGEYQLLPVTLPSHQTVHDASDLVPIIADQLQYASKEAIFDFFPLQPDNEATQTYVVIVAPMTLLTEKVRTVMDAGLKVANIEIDVIAAARFMGLVTSTSNNTCVYLSLNPKGRSTILVTRQSEYLFGSDFMIEGCVPTDCGRIAATLIQRISTSICSSDSPMDTKNVDLFVLAHEQGLVLAEQLQAQVRHDMGGQNVTQTVQINDSHPDSLLTGSQLAIGGSLWELRGETLSASPG